MPATRVAFLAPPFAGHLNPLLVLAEAARGAGYAVEVVTGAGKRTAVEGRGLVCRVLPGLDDGVMECIANTDRPVGGNPLRLLEQLRASLAVVARGRRELLPLWRTQPPDIVVADSIAVIGGLVAEELGLPWITTVATPFAMECRRGVPSYLGGWSEMPGPVGRLRDAVGWGVVRTVKRGCAFMVREQLRELGARLYREDGSEFCYSPRAILGFGMMELEFPRDWPASFRMIGPVFANPEPTPSVVLPAHRPRVLVSLGTHLLWAKARLAGDLAWLASRRPGVMFIGSHGESQRMGEPPEILAPNARLYPFIPYTDHMGGFDAVIHHGGAGVTYAAIHAGVPAVVVPHDYDQFDFAARVAARGAGLRVRRLAGAATLRALDRVLTPGAFPALAELQAASRRYDPAGSFLALLSEIVPGA